jgi:hypothetical protein
MLRKSATVEGGLPWPKAGDASFGPASFAELVTAMARGNGVQLLATK